VFKNRPGAGLV